MESYKSLPFATYDLAVYLPGGALLTLIGRYVLDEVFGFHVGGLDALVGDDAVGLAIKAITWLSVSYLLGHLGAFISTYTVERVVHRFLGYPSDNWLEREKLVNGGQANEKEIQKTLLSKTLSVGRKDFGISASLSLIFLLPLPPFVVAFLIFKPVGFYSAKLPEAIYSDLRQRFKLLGVSVEVQRGTRWDKIVEHYVSNNCAGGYVRMYNYLVIYGALRLLAFVMTLLLWVIIISDFKQIFEIGYDFHLGKTIAFFGLSGATFMSMMAFAKFNRRYFEESIMAFLLTPFVPIAPAAEPPRRR
ncbi:hypothetical protein M3P36_03520 [Altererythrobacter sp. KTW20L]|uniref:hypothetical protein n=1 Tax=Altererythrobacter sp. KTW20L TaxID=2942210 RepID=UPI0020BEEA55|nr:hypothetical protein [Altererythrobacter sp. KTW20L]MCL6250117.1 hypothetical protein [Altererythrobacter sp. KTW20L]